MATDLKEQALRQEVLAARGPKEMGQAYQHLFLHVTPVRLDELRRDPNPSIAIQATWEIARTHQLPSDRMLRPLDSSYLEQFLVTLREKLGLEPPGWWKESLLSAASINGEATIFYGAKASDFHDTSLKISCPKNVQLMRKAGNIVLSVDSRDITLARSLSEKLENRREGDRCVVALGADYTILGVFSKWGFPFDLWAINSNTGEAHWKSQVWATGRDEGTGMGAGHQVMAVINDDRVLIYGCEGRGMYMEMLSLSDGRCLVRYSSNYWVNVSENSEK